MFYVEIQLILMLFLILAASQLFTNALEHVGQRAGISAGVIGSVFAAVATALPETMVPFVALIAGSSNSNVNLQVSVGAILGAPLMIATLSTAIMALFAFKGRGFRGRISPEWMGYSRDLNFFIAAFLLAAVALFLPLEPLIFRGTISCLLVGLYLTYLVFTFKASKGLVKEGHGVLADDPLYMTIVGVKENKTTIGLQLLFGLVLLLLGAKGFILGVEALSTRYQLSALVLSLLVIPIATELPEKVNSVLWVRKMKDTLAFGNLTGALVFQGTLLPALGVLLGSWQPNKEVLCAILMTLLAAIWLRMSAAKKGVPLLALLLNGCLYLVYLYVIFH